MEFCSMCSTSFDSDEDRRIRCSGQHCNLVFHQRCVHLTEVHLRSWLDDDVGLVWFCPACRLDFAPGTSSSRRKLGIAGDQRSREEDGERQRKIVRLDPVTRLPPEIWIMVFGYLESRWLARVRLVCRDFNELVCNRTELMDRFLLKLTRSQFVDDIDEVRHFLALGRGFTRAEFSNLYHSKDKPRIEWFSILGETLTTLTCRYIPFGFLCQLLKALPNLKRLTLSYCFEHGKSAKLKYQLFNLEQLTIQSFYNKNYGNTIFPILQHICPNITVLELNGSKFDEFTKQISSFMHTVRNSLQKLSLNGSGLMKEFINVSKDLRLKQLSIYCTEHDLLRLIQRLPSLEHLHFRNRLTNVSIFEEIPRILPNLKTLELNKVALTATSPPSPLNLTRAEFIRVHYDDTPDCISGLSFCESSSLQRLEISGAYLPSNALANLGQVAIRIKNVTLSNCRVKCASDILTFCKRSKSLTSLEVWDLGVYCFDDIPDPTADNSNIRHLKINCKSRELPIALIELCPNLESLDIANPVSEEDVSRMGQQLKRLRSLKLCGKEMTREILRQIPNGFEALQNLQIDRCVVSRKKVQAALEGLRKDVYVSIEYTMRSHRIVKSPPRRLLSSPLRPPFYASPPRAPRSSTSSSDD